MNRNKNIIKCVRLLCMHIAACALMLSSCANDDLDKPGNSQQRHEIRVAILMQSAERERWERTAENALENIREAQFGLSNAVDIIPEFFEQDSPDIEAIMDEIVADPEIVAVIGPTTSACATRMGEIIATANRKDLPMITPCATDVEYQRKFSKSGFVWNLAESDISELEVIISRIAGIPDLGKVFLLTGSESAGTGIGNVYEEWFGFIAGEYSLPIGGMCMYQDENDVRKFVRELCGYDWHLGENALVFNPSDTDMILAVDDELRKIREATPKGKYFYSPHIYCSDAFVSDAITEAVSDGLYEGIDLYVRPESGFHQAYRQRTGQDLINGEGQFYDALNLTAYASTRSLVTGKSLNDAILDVVDGNDGRGESWLPEDMRLNFAQLQAGVCPDIDGVSSTWTFDAKTHSCVIGSTYRHWRLNDGKFVTMEYVSVNSTNHSSSSRNMWDWTSSHIESIDGGEGKVPEYPALDERWALLVAGSAGWPNYRFQADVFATYRLLRQSGYDDDHIVLIVADDIADNPKNPIPGVIKIKESGENVYTYDAIDYRLADITPEDIGKILRGERSERLPHVISSDSGDNIFIFWSGHGNPGSFDFGGNRQLPHREMRDYIGMTPHRKLLFAVESCYGGGIGERCKGLSGVLVITAANPYETSHADVWSENVGVYLSNGFTQGFLDTVNKDRSVTLRDLYYSIASTTAGSHVKLYNADSYGSVYSNTMSDFM